MEKQFNFICNDKLISEKLNPALTVLDFLRIEKKLTGTKEGCREGDCGACTVLIGNLDGNKIKYKSVNSCLLPLNSINRKHLVSIEGLNIAGLTIIQEQLVDEGGTQCGFCTPGFVVSLINYFLNKDDYNLDDAITALDGNICRCTGYAGIKRAIENTIKFLGKNESNNRINFLINKKILPEYFSSIPKQLKEINSKYIFKGEKHSRANLLVSGGTDLYVQQRDSIHELQVSFVDENYEQKKIWRAAKRIFISGATTIEEFRKSILIQRFIPNIKDSLLLFGSLPIRNRATIAGNIVNASPIADITNILLVLNASVHLTSGKKKRTVPLNKFYLAYKKLNKKKGELISSISFEVPKKNLFFNFEKVSRRTYLDIASVNSSISIITKENRIWDIHISAGGVAPVPFYLEKTKNYLLNKHVTTENILSAAEVALNEITPISDARGSAEYKSLLLRQLIYSHFIKLFPNYLMSKDFV